MKNKTIYKQIWYDYNQYTNWIEKFVKEWNEIRPDDKADRDFVLRWFGGQIPIKIKSRYEYCIYKNLFRGYGLDIDGFVDKIDKNNYEIYPNAKTLFFKIMQSYLISYCVKNKKMSTAHFILTGEWL